MGNKIFAILVVLGIVGMTLVAPAAMADTTMDDANDELPALVSSGCDGALDCVVYLCDQAGQAVDELTGKGWRCI